MFLFTPLKQVIKNDDGSVILRPRNPEYPPHTYPVEDVMGGFLNVAGVVVGPKGKSNNNGGKEHD